jgi:hypothetical protein
MNLLQNEKINYWLVRMCHVCNGWATQVYLKYINIIFIYD